MFGGIVYTKNPILIIKAHRFGNIGVYWGCGSDGRPEHQILWSHEALMPVEYVDVRELRFLLTLVPCQNIM